MSRPRQILPGSTYHITRRTSERRFFLAPGTMLNLIFMYCLAYAARKYDIAIHAFSVMSNHFHLVLTDPYGRLPAFMAWLDQFTAKAVNVLRGRWENVWASGSYSTQLLETEEDILDTMVYVLGNPVRAGLVAYSAQWPGASSCGYRFPAEIEVERPRVFFRCDGPMPQEVTLRLSKPKAFAHLSDHDFWHLLQSRLGAYEAEQRSQIRAAGRNFVGERKILRLNPFSRPTTREPRRNLRPRIKAREGEIRRRAFERLRAFLDDYRVAFQEWRAGARDVLFPAGTYALRVYAGVACRSP